MFRNFWLELACVCLCVCLCVLRAQCEMASRGGSSAFVLLYLVVDPAEYGGSTAPPFIPLHIRNIPTVGPFFMKSSMLVVCVKRKV